MQPSTRSLFYACLIVCAAALVGCDDGANGQINSNDPEDANTVDPGRRDNRPPVEMGVPDAVTPDPEPEPEPEPDRGPPDTGLDLAVDAAVDAQADAALGDGPLGPPDCVEGAIRDCEGCVGSSETCAEGAWGPCEPPPELCNGADDDCDGAVDELFAVGEECAVGAGLCRREGATVCDGPAAVRCDAEPGAPDNEGCNQLDDDCDGTVDEGLGGGDPCVVGVGACQVRALTVCLDERPFCPPEPERPLLELCNAIDDDCDGTVDEDFDVGGPCDVGQGRCRAAGVWACTDDGDALCAADPLDAIDEACNGEDDDCDGAVDEGFGPEGACFEGIGACVREGTVVCDGAGELRCSAEPGPPSDELCDGIDDDCDGEVDEAFPLGEPCEVGAGACIRGGTWVCADDGRARCSVEEGEPGVETCNEVDDDCDGEVDEGFGIDERCEAGVGRCEAGGRVVCGDDGLPGCDARLGAPVDEACNGADDDCDGAVDEGFEVGAPCVGGRGECARDGRIDCAADGAAVCAAQPGEPAFEVCDGEDDDCDGEIDEGLGLGGPCTVGEGGCQRPGRLVCGDDAVVCDGEPGLPMDERCNAIDDDCDGETDEALAWQDIPLGERCAVGIGACRATGRVVCDADDAAACDAAPGAPVDEVCNGIDDDCDGTADEGFELGAPCAVGEGACLRRGQRVCGDDGAVCSVAPGGPVDELCNDIDDDCDGIVDEDQRFGDAPLGGRCELGIGRCLAGGEVVCGDDGAATCDARPGRPRGERCNSVDDDCDGETDEDLGLGERCVEGIGACARAGVSICGDDDDVICTATAGEPADELCDAIDNDCDGPVDEDYPLGEACTVGLGACAADGAEVCAADRQGTRCGAVPGAPTDEACNDVDDDCDGPVDEAFPLGEACRVGRGTCLREGAFVCAADGDAACDAVPGEPAPAEACDARDDDCDGATDEDFRLGEDCISGLGICAEEGSRICLADGTGGCDAEPGAPQDELCNDLDDDCDGIVDEGGDGPPGVAFGICGPRYRSCLDALRAGGVESGIYRVSSANTAGREVYCDQTTDGGGWTLVMATAAPPTDGIGPWHEELLGTDPVGAHPGVWAGLSHLGDRPFDVRFACRAAPDDAAGARAPYDVDVAFYGTPWYRTFIGGGEAVSCFEPIDGGGTLPARKDINGRAVRAHGQPYPPAAQGRLVGEPACASPGTFFTDFDDGGLAGRAVDGTDWGAVGGRGICGRAADGGQWLIFAREEVPHPLGPVGLIGLPQLAGPLEVAGFEPVVLDPTAVDFDAQLDALPAVFLGRYAMDWASFPAGIVRDRLGCYTFDGGSLVTELDGISMLGTRFADDFEWLEGAPEAWGWLALDVGGGAALGADTVVTITDAGDPTTRGLGARFRAGGATERFVHFNKVHPTIDTDLSPLATFVADEGADPPVVLPALVRAGQCGGNFIAGAFDFADGPEHPAIVRLVGNLAAAAVSPPPPGLEDVCAGFLGVDRCPQGRP